MFLFFFFYNSFILPIQASIGHKIINSINENLLSVNSNLELEIRKSRISINSISPSYVVSYFNLPFGFYYFLVLFIIWFKPTRLINVLSIYDLVLLFSYFLFIYFFFKGYDFFIAMININQGFYKIIYATIFFLKVLRLNIFNFVLKNN